MTFFKCFFIAHFSSFNFCYSFLIFIYQAKDMNGSVLFTFFKA